MTARRDHKGDFMSPETRSRVMSKIRGSNTGPERETAEILTSLNLKYETQAKDLPGRPDFVIRALKIAIFVDGDFWHGWNFPKWKHKLSEKWELKIAATRLRDQKNHRKLRRMGWKVLRIWEHQLKKNRSKCRDRIVHCINQAEQDLHSAL